MATPTKGIDYKKLYSVYRVLPIILAAISATGIILTVTVAFFRLLLAERAGMAFLIFSAGVLLAAISFAIIAFFTSLLISPVIVRTDSLIEINEKLDGGSTTTKHTTRTTTTKTVPKWRCPTCGTTNDMSATTCAHCFHKRPTATASTSTATKWCCPSCGSTNEMSMAVCPTCSYKKP